MKTLLLTISLILSTSSFASCEMQKKAKKLISSIEKYDVEIVQSFVQEDIQEAKDMINDGSFCSNGFGALSLCTGLTIEHAYFGGLKAESPKNQKRLEKSLFEFAKMFSTPTGDSFGCNLIELEYPAL